MRSGVRGLRREGLSTYEISTRLAGEGTPLIRTSAAGDRLDHHRDRLATAARAKEPLLAAASDILPAQIHARVKTKFSAPGMRWLTRTPLAAQLPELVLGSGHHTRLGLLRTGLETLLAAFTRDPHTYYMPTWGIFLLFLWTDLHAP